MNKAVKWIIWLVVIALIGWGLFAWLGDGCANEPTEIEADYGADVDTNVDADYDVDTDVDTDVDADADVDADEDDDNGDED